MGERALRNRINKLMQIEEQQKALQEQADKLKEEIKADMEAKRKDEIKAGDYIVRFKKVLSSRFDSKVFKADHAKLFEAYSRPAEVKRFTIA